MVNLDFPVFHDEPSPAGLRRTLRFAAQGIRAAGPIVLWVIVITFGLIGALGELNCNVNGEPVDIPRPLAGSMCTLIGLAIGAWAMTMFGRAEAELTVTADTVEFREVGVLRTHRVSVPRASVTAVGIGDSAIGGGDDTPWPELKVHSADGSQTGMLRGRYPQELEHAAAMLRAELRVPAPTPMGIKG